MIGTILLVILCLLLLMLVILLLLPAQVRVAYDMGDLTAELRYGTLRIPLYPREGKEKKPKEKIAEETDKKSEKKKLSVNREQILYSLEKLPPILGRALRRVGNRICIAPLKVHLLVAGTDPADTAMLYGKLEAALAAGLPVLHRAVKIREQDVRLFLDFQQEQMDCIADVGVRIRPWDVLVIALCAGGSALRWLIGFRKLSNDQNTKQTKSNDTTSAA